MISSVSRRGFLKSTAATITPYFFTGARPRSSIISKSPNDLPSLGLVGAGRMGFNHLRFAKGMCNVVAVCDVDENHREHAKAKLTGGKGKAYNDYRKIIEDDSVDVMYIATPDHWHAKILIEALHAGKDVYCEKPLTLTIDEGRLIRESVKATGGIVQVGTMQRSYRDLFVKAVAMCEEGRLGKIRKITAVVDGSGVSGPLPKVDVPKWLDWNQWLGPAPKADFRLIEEKKEGEIWKIGKTNAHQQFRWWYDYSGGKLTDWGAHHVDIACWALRAAGQSDEFLSVSGDAALPCEYKDGNPVRNDCYNTTHRFSLTAKMKGGVELVMASEGGNGVLIEGDRGRIKVNRGRLVGKPAEELKDNPLPEGAIEKAYRNFPMEFNRHKNHWANFFHCTRERIDPISDVDSHLKAINLCHLANISARFGREMVWDAKKGRIMGDDLANVLVSRPYREGFEIDV